MAKRTLPQSIPRGRIFPAQIAGYAMLRESRSNPNRSSSGAEQAVTEADPQARIAGVVALAHHGTEHHRAGATAALVGLNPGELSESQLLGLLRAYALTFIRLGEPTGTEREQIIASLDAHFPHSSKDVNTEMVRVLVYLQAPNVIAKAMKLIENRGEPEVPDWTELAGRNKNYGGRVLAMLANHPPTHEINYSFMLRSLRKGWTVDERRSYIQFINAAAKYPGGNSYGKFLTNVRNEVLGYMTNAERAAVADISGENFNPVPDFQITAPKGPGQKLDPRSRQQTHQRQRDPRRKLRERPQPLPRRRLRSLPPIRWPRR